MQYATDLIQLIEREDGREIISNVREW